jgi:NADH:ubiquinone oxidoreductase subunit 2 (subunit N)
MNLLSFIPLIINTQRVLSSESALKYFLIQALTSLILMFGLVLNFYMGYNLSFTFINGTPIILLALFIKLGGAPFHIWFPDVAGGVS